MTGRSIIIIGIIGIVILIVVGMALGMRNTAAQPDLASVSGAWYGANGQTLVSPPYVSGAPQQYYVVGQQAQTLPQPQTQVQYVTVPAPVIVGSFDNDADASANTSRATTRGSNYSTYTNTSVSNAPYPTFAEYEAQYYAQSGSTQYPAYPVYNTYPQYPPINTYGGAPVPPVYGYSQYPGYGAMGGPAYPTFNEYEAYYYSRYRQL